MLGTPFILEKEFGPKMPINNGQFMSIFKGNGDLNLLPKGKNFFKRDVNGKIESLQLASLSINGSVSLNNLNIDYEIRLVNCDFNGNFILSKFNSSKIFMFSFCNISNNLEISNSKIDEFFLGDLNLNGGFAINQKSNFKLIHFQGFNLLNSGFLNNFYAEKFIIRRATLKHFKIFGYNSIIDELEIGYVYAEDMDIENSVINKILFTSTFRDNSKLLLNNNRINQLEFGNFVNKAHIEFINVEIGDFARDNSEILLKNVIDKNTLKEIEKIIIDKTSVENLLNKKVQELSYKDLKNIGGWEFQRKFYHKNAPEIISSLKIIKSDLGNIYFKNFNFENFKSVVIDDSELNLINLFNSYLPLKNIKGNPIALYETFNEMYNIATKKNNIRDRVEYYKASQHFLLKSSLNRKWYFRIPSIISSFTSKFYSNFGTRWTQSCMVTFLFGLLFFSLMMLSTNYDFDFKIRSSSWKNFKDLSAFFIQYLNPFHNIEFLDSYIYNISSSTKFVLFDFLGRIFISIGIFETIRSFRKYVRK
ncbi:hypothetical protein [Flavobacterium sp.]|uniref:hypothetical protein n=1 Tax=Flavobacterium sp. TaxID=239 RepID=UPI0035277A3B